MSNSVRPYPWDSPGKNTGVGCHFLLQCIKVKSESEVAQSCMSDSSQPHRLQPTRLLHPWYFPGKSTGVGCHCLLLQTHIQAYKCKNSHCQCLWTQFSTGDFIWILTIYMKIIEVKLSQPSLRWDNINVYFTLIMKP